MNKYQKTICWLMLLLSVYFTAIILWRYNAQCEYQGLTISEQPEPLLERRLEPLSLTLIVIFESKEQLIERLAIENDFDVKTALSIAHCESHYGLYNFNKYSSAKGMYQFIDKTWKNYCSGDVLNDYDNINCFIKLYQTHRSWWKCSYDNL